MVLSSVGAALVLLAAVVGTTMGAAVGPTTFVDGYGHLPPPRFRGPVHLLPSECPPVTRVFDFTQTVVVRLQETLTTTKINYWPKETVVTMAVYETSTVLVPLVTTVTPPAGRQTLYTTATSTVLKNVEEYHVATAVDTTFTQEFMEFLQYVTPTVITEYLPLTKTVTHTVKSSFSSTYTHHTTLLVTDYSTVTATKQVVVTITDFSTVFNTQVVTDVVKSSVWETATSVVATSFVPVTATASCVPVQPALLPLEQHGHKAKASVHEKMLKAKEYLREKFSETYNKGLQAFDVHIDKLRRKVDESKKLSTSSVSTSLADTPSLRRHRVKSPLDYEYPKGTKSDAGLLGAGKAGGSGKGTGLSWITDLFSKGPGKGGDKGTAGLGSGKGDLGGGDLADLKALAGPLLQEFKSGLGHGKGAAAPLIGGHGSAPLASETHFPSHY